MNKVAKTEHDAILEIPLIIGIGVISIEPAVAIVVPLDVEDVRVAVGVNIVHDAFCATTP